MKKNIKLLICYDGTNYSGWQRQKNKETIQGIIEDRLKKVTGDKQIKLYGSGRTDAGVHAIGQTANFYTEHDLPVDKWTFVLNNKLPGDIKIKHAKIVNNEFHARFSAKSKIYKYYILNKNYGTSSYSAKRIFLNKYCYIYNKKLDIDRMKEVAQYLIGEHDFRALSCLNKKKNDRKENKERTIIKIDIQKNKEMLCFRIEANSFLYKMMRVIVGTLLDFSITKRNPKDILSLMKNKDCQKSGKVLPPNGLFLVKVKY